MLHITLRDGEKVIVNGAVLRAVGRTQIAVEIQVSILRGREIMRPEEATSTARQLYFAAMLAYIDPASRAAHQDAEVALVAALIAEASSDEMRRACIQFAAEIAQGDFYKALAGARALNANEERDAKAETR